MGGGELSSVSYGFFEGKFGYVVVSFPGGGVNFSKIKAAVFERYGVGLQGNKYIEIYSWFSNDDAYLILLKDDEYGEGKLWLSTQKFMSDSASERKKRAKEGAEKDF